jgi:hypothetical protein
VAAASPGTFAGLTVIGLPVAIDEELFNCAAGVHGGRIPAFY